MTKSNFKKLVVTFSLLRHHFVSMTSFFLAMMKHLLSDLKAVCCVIFNIHC